MKVSEIRVGQVFTIPADQDGVTYTMLENGMVEGVDAQSNRAEPLPASELGDAEVSICSDTVA